MTISIYEPRTMAAALDKMMPARAFLRRKFFGGTPETSATEKVDVDIRIGGRSVAPFVNPRSAGKAVDRPGFETRTYTAPLLAPMRVITTDDLQTRLPGEHAYAGTDPNDRLAKLLGRDLADLDEMISRAEELMARNALVNSSIRVKGDDVDYTITFPRDASLAVGLLAAAQRWSATTADIYGQIIDWNILIEKLTGVAADTLVLSAEAAKALVGNAENRAKLNTLNMQMGRIAPEAPIEGASYLGEFAGTGVSIYAYSEWYRDPDTGILTPMIPAKTILLGSSKAYTAMRYGAVSVVDGETIGLVPAPRVPESWVERNPAGRFVRLSSRPLPVPVDNNCFLTAQVLQ